MFGSVSAVKSQEAPNFSEPFKKCRTYGAVNGMSRVVASDNGSNIIISSDNSNLLSVNFLTNLENWKTQTVGKLDPAAVSDSNSLYFISSFENGIKEKIFLLNSLSLKTGITNWQKKLSNYKEVIIKGSPNNEFLFLVAEDKSIFAVQKSDGSIIWSKNFQNEILSLNASNSSQDSSLNILFAERLLRISTKTGDLIDEIEIKKRSVSDSLANENYLLLGYPTGEFLKVSISGNKSEVLWKIKTGGSITSLIELDGNVLITSLDNFMYYFSTENGKLKWKRRVSGRINIKPVTYGNYALVLSSADSTASIIELREGKVINQIVIEDDNYFSGQPIVSGNYFIFQTFRGIYLFVNSSTECK
jgi:outer membrane protein assembly factor BamB